MHFTNTKTWMKLNRKRTQSQIEVGNYTGKQVAQVIIVITTTI